MPRKCDKCKQLRLAAGKEFCDSPDVFRAAANTTWVIMTLDRAREICNKEGDGIFVYFEPKTPSAGAAVQPDDWRKEMNKYMTVGGSR